MANIGVHVRIVESSVSPREPAEGMEATWQMFVVVVNLWRGRAAEIPAACSVRTAVELDRASSNSRGNASN